jgi:hypothetical protein
MKHFIIRCQFNIMLTGYLKKNNANANIYIMDNDMF